MTKKITFKDLNIPLKIVVVVVWIDIIINFIIGLLYGVGF